MTPAMPDDSSGSYSYSPSPISCYSDRDARRFKAERDETRHELGDVSKKAGIAELEWGTSASSCWRPLTVNLMICFNFNSNSELTAIASHYCRP
jgi:hypothetical protein